MAESNLFAQTARERGCTGHIAAQHIRQATRLSSRSAEGGVVFTDLFPSTSRLRACLRDVSQLQGLLRCPCDICIGTTRLTPDDHDRKLAQAIANPDPSNDGLRRCFAVLALAGCLFAFRMWDRYATGGEVTPYLDRLLHPAEFEDRQALFDPFIRTRRTRLTVDELADIFAQCVREKLWITNIPRFEVGGQRKKLYEANLPFTHVIPVASTGLRPGKLFREIRFDPDYCDSPELKKRLFLKRLSFHHADLPAKQAAQQEILNLLEMKALGIDGVAELLLTFTTLDRFQQHEHLIFNFYPQDLEQILQSKTVENLPQIYQRTRTSNAVDLPLSKHTLWESALALLDTISKIHDPPQSATGLPAGQTLQAAHLDLKPANIVADAHGRLLLIDLEHAVLNVRTGADQTTQFSARAGTPSYRPPEGENTGTTQFRRSYDVWSLGCVLLEVMVCLIHLTAGGDSVVLFREARYAEDTPGERNLAFWRMTASGYSLKSTVNRQIESVMLHFGERAANQIRKMLAVDPASRPKSMQDCKEEFTSQGDLDELTFIPWEEEAIMPVRVAKMKVSFTTERRPNPYACELQLYKSFDRNREEKTLTLVIVCGDRNRRMYVPSSARIDGLTFVPISHYDPNAILGDASSPESGLQCRLTGLNGGTTLHFQIAKDFRLFQTLMTYQQPCSVKGVNGLGLKFNSCALRLTSKRPFRGESRAYGFGHAQLLYRLSESQYKAYVREDETVPAPNSAPRNSTISTGTSFSSLERPPTRTTTATTTVNGNLSPPSPHSDSLPNSLSRYRIALYTSSLSSSSQRVCIIFNVDRQDCIPEVNPNGDGNAIIFRGAFIAAVLEAPPETWSGAPSAYPGYPLAPELLDQATGDKESKIAPTVKLETLTLTMRNRQERRDLIAILKDKIKDT